MHEPDDTTSTLAVFTKVPKPLKFESLLFAASARALITFSLYLFIQIIIVLSQKTYWQPQKQQYTNNSLNESNGFRLRKQILNRQVRNFYWN